MERVKLVFLPIAALLALILAPLGAAQDTSEKQRDVRKLWSVDIPKQLQGLVYEARALQRDKPLVLATSRDYVLRIDGEIGTLFGLKRSGKIGESALLPSSSVGTRESLVVGILEHDHHAIGRFRLVTLDGKTIARVDDARHFHYRVAPDGRSFVGIDSRGKHAALSAKRIFYRFFDRSGKRIGQIESLAPQLNDSAYSPDGASFLVNNGAGLTSYSARNTKPQWTVASKARMFAAASSQSGKVLVVHEEQRSGAVLYESGKERIKVSLKELGADGNVRNVAIAPDGRVAAISGQSVVALLAPGTQTPVRVYRLDRRLTVNSLSVGNDGTVAVGAQQASVQGNDAAEGKLIVLNSDAKVIFEKDTAHQRSNAWIPTVQFDASGKLLLVQTLEQLMLYSL